eukprot:TRINITY_DN40583_c0_g1_i1.p1 TRINITY_DN40583_c0_g1~~TRINITY_DN40583_c0_g1_i1.p1  ORF type:complete len:552 (+),score=107.99 TRINITY_DN40583_c0_g1_i1:41-1696(+)
MAGGRPRRERQRTAARKCRLWALGLGCAATFAATTVWRGAADAESFCAPTQGTRQAQRRLRSSLLCRRLDEATAGSRDVSVGRCIKVGDTIDGIVLEEFLGAGRFGTTWRGRALGSNASDDAGTSSSSLGLEEGQTVAVKLVRLEEGWDSLDRFEREAAVLRRLDHYAIPRFYGSVIRDRPDGQDFALVSDLAAGASLEQLVQDGRWIASAAIVRRLAETLLEVCAHLATYAPPVVHRDIKPANVIVELPRAGEDAMAHVKLVDFGAAVLGSGQQKTSIGTFGFMAPESFGQLFTPKTDLYGVGATLLYAATGREPGTFETDRLKLKFRDAFVGTPWERDEAWLPELLDRLLAPAPEDRFASAQEALSFLQGSWTGGQEELTPPRGSALKVVRTGFDLDVLLPPPSLGASASTGLFATVWTAFVAFWTTSVLAAGAPIMALFSLPFWGAGGALLKESFGPVLKGAMTLRIGRERWSYGKVASETKEIEGRTDKLECDVVTTIVVNGRPQQAVVLREGVVEQLVNGRLQQVEIDWLSQVIKEHITRCQAGRL